MPSLRRGKDRGYKQNCVGWGTRTITELPRDKIVLMWRVGFAGSSRHFLVAAAAEAPCRAGVLLARGLGLMVLKMWLYWELAQ
mmetsp:Transcript_1009/g.3560  ORF Transcript_1009/g.3560 Transcript_1009/m.3560 type:complete len:83 (-) Transcript_1009:758-1006(-)